MSIYACDICKKEFKTNQHLAQHKNKKKNCTSNTDDNLLTNTSALLKNTELSANDIIKFINTYSTLQCLIKDKELVEEYKKTIIQLKKDNSILKHQLHLINKVIKNSTESIIKEHTEKVVNISKMAEDDKLININDNTLVSLSSKVDDSS